MNTLFKTNDREISDKSNSFDFLKRNLRGLAASGLLVVVTICSSCETPTKPLPEQMAPPARVSLAPGDILKFTFSGAPEFNQSQKVRADGKLSLPQIGEVDAAGKTLVDFQTELVSRYKTQLKNSDVLVTLEGGVTQVYISGAVSKPGKIVFERPTTVLQAITEAGGVNDYGTLRGVHLIRLVNGVQHTQVMDLRPTIRGSTTRAFYVRDGDVITVPQSSF